MPADEQRHLDALYARLDEMRTAAATPRWRARLDAAEDRLCFGRLDLTDGRRLHIGRIGLSAPDGGDPLLVDWRAPAARPFYAATPAEPLGVRRRRRLITEGRTLVAVDDEVLAGWPAGAPAESLAGDAALLAAITAPRTGRMRDVVATLRAEQDAIIRADHRGILVVQGGPGTGKTVVALHRAAYLLYHHPAMAARGVLVVGPSEVFAEYIGRVLPGLGETAVVTATIERLVPGVSAGRTEPGAVAEIKGRLAMAEVLAGAVRRRQTAACAGFRTEDLAYARTRARTSGLPHNPARTVFRTALADRLAGRAARAAEAGEAEVEQVLAGAGVDEAIERDLAELGLPRVGADDSRADPAAARRAYAADPAVSAATDACWPALTAAQVVADVLAGPDRHAPGWSAADRDLLRRAPGGAWSAADIPLLDEAFDLLGDGPETPADTEGGATVAERAARDRGWAYGHVVVDEAQELSAMAWRMVLRRAPARSMTVTGDVAQTSAPGGAESWEQALRPHAGTRWRTARLSVNYRTPREIMRAAERVRGGGDGTTSVRRSGEPPWRIRTTGRHLPGVVARLARREAGHGRVAVIAPEHRIAGLAARVPLGTGDLTDPIVLLGVRQAKGLEFDVVLVADPAGILAGPRGRADLYVAMTRATRRLVLVHPGAPPAGIARLSRPWAPTSGGAPPHGRRSGTSPGGTARG